jgi:hypothetical protein
MGFIMRLGSAAGVLSVAMLLTTLPASAATITDDVTFNVAGFSTFPLGGVPTDPVTGSFTITFDPTQNYTAGTTAGITLNSLNITAGSAISFCYSASAYSCGGVAFSADELVVGGISDGTALVQFSPATDDYVLQISNFTSSPVFTEMVYAQTSEGNFDNFTTPGVSTGSVTVTPGVSATPIPAAFPLFAGGLGLMSFLGRRRKRRGALAAA